jgi:subtilase family serine protease
MTRNRATDMRAPKVLGFRVVLAIAAAMMVCVSSSKPSFAQETRRRNESHIPAGVRYLKPLARVESTQSLDLILGLPLRNTGQVDGTIQALYDPTNPRFHAFYSPEAFEAAFAPSAASLASVTSYAKKNGLTVVDTPGGLFVRVRGSAAIVERVFHTKIQTYQHPYEARTFYAPSIEPQWPSTLPITHISGLDNFFTLRPFTTPCKNATEVKTPPSGALWGQAFRKAFAPDVAATGKGQVIGIFSLDGFYQADLNAYQDAAGISRVTIDTVLSGSATGSASSDNCEVSMDIENALSMAPGVTQITVYEADYSNASVIAQLAEMAKPTKGEPLPGQISTSYSFFYDSNVYAALNRFSMQGQAFFTASGDFGAYTAYGAYNQNTPYPPQDYPWITSVGGTVLVTDSNAAWSSETGWSGSGGGYSPWQCGDSTFDIPGYQTGLSNSSNRASTLARNVPDVAMPSTNIAARSENGIWSMTGGTSASSPLWAGFSALVNEVAASKGLGQLGFLNPALYAIGKSPSYATAFHDITQGSNSNTVDPYQFGAVSGYDLVTGWGTPRGQATINAIIEVSTPKVNCAELATLLADLAKQLAEAEARSRTTACGGQASLLCARETEAIQQQINAETAISNKYCRSAQRSSERPVMRVAALPVMHTDPVRQVTRVRFFACR